MLLVKTAVKQSPIAGLGLFADENIKEGQMVWRYDPNSSLLITRPQMTTFLASSESEQTALFYLMYGFYVAPMDGLLLCLDNGRFVNHSTSCNLGPVNLDQETRWRYSIALRDIEKGEELTEDYSISFDPSDWVNELCQEHQIFTPEGKKEIQA
jgi:uncharacterized protein